MYASGINMHNVARWLERDFPEIGKKASYRTTLYNDVLKNPRYRGDVVLQKTFKTSYVNGLIKRNKGERPIYIYENYHPHIVPKSFFNYVQERKTNNTFTNYSTTFNQLIFCGECTRNLNSVCRNRGGKRDSYYSCNVFRHRSGMYCNTPYYDRFLIDDIFKNIIKSLIDIDKLQTKIKELLQITIFTSLNSKKKYTLLDLKTRLGLQKAEMKKCEALAIENPSIIEDEEYKNKVSSIKNTMISLARQIKIANKEFDLNKKETQINERLNKILSQPLNYTLLADLRHLKAILLPGYRIIIVKCKSDTTKEDFRKQIKTIVASIDESQYLDSLSVRNNGEMIKYRFTFK